MIGSGPRAQGGGRRDDDVSVVIPAYNEESEIGALLEHVREALSRAACHRGCEVIVVDDGSTDRTAAIAGSVEGVKVIRLPYNMGYGAAIKAGTRSAGHGWILTLDSDGQHRLDSLPSFFKAQEEGYDLIIGNRCHGAHPAWVRRPGKMIMRLVSNYLAGTAIPDVNSGLRLFKKSVFLEFLPLYPNGFSISTTTTLAFMGDGYSVTFVPVTVYERAGRASNVNVVSDGINTVIMIMRTISLFNPLRVFIPAAVVCGVIGVGMTILNIGLHGRVPNTGVVMSLGALLILLFGILADQFSLLRRQHGARK
ncbi:MAG: glycosyltransferase family 2 protein [Elusimicrobia bacterium]|nr:glycosyltransferase family 2 protein [Elusimicrobiota bacterium]